MRSARLSSSIFVVLALALSACSSTPFSKAASDPSRAGGTPAPQGKASTQDSLSAKLSEVVGQVLARAAESTDFSNATEGYILQVLGQVQTKTDGKVRLDFSTGTLVRLGPNTLFTLQPSQQNDQGLLIQLQMALGKAWVILKGGGTLQVQTPSGVAAVLGSFMGVTYNPNTGDLRITCLEGHCSLTTKVGSVEITTGQAAEVTGPNQVPQVSQMTPQDYQDWMANNPDSSAYIPASDGGSAPDNTTAQGTGYQGQGQGRGQGSGGGQGSGKGGKP